MKRDKKKHRDYMREYSKKPEQRAKTLNRIKRRRARIRAEIDAYKANGCTCGENDLRCLDLHHKDPKAKLTPRGGISQVIYRWGIARIRAELQKCTVLCGNCHRAQHTDEPPNKGQSPPVVMPSEEELAAMSKGRRCYWRNRAKNLARVQRRRAELLAWYKELKKDGCGRCGESRPECLDFHHRNPEEKDGTLAKLIYTGRSKERLLEEIEKCDLLCANCHRKEH